MPCEACGTARVAVHLTRVRDGVVIQHELCVACAAGYGVDASVVAPTRTIGEWLGRPELDVPLDTPLDDAEERRLLRALGLEVGDESPNADAGRPDRELPPPAA